MGRALATVTRGLLRMGDGEVEGRALAGLRLDPDPAAVALDDFLADRQADAGAGILVAGVQALEDQEDAFGVLRVDADAVVADGEEPCVGAGRSAQRGCAGGRSPRNLMALPMRFWKSWAN